MLVQHFATHFDHFQKCVFPVLKSWHLLEARHNQLRQTSQRLQLPNRTWLSQPIQRSPSPGLFTVDACMQQCGKKCRFANIIEKSEKSVWNQQYTEIANARRAKLQTRGMCTIPKSTDFWRLPLKTAELCGSKVFFPAPGGFVLPTHTVGWVGEPD